MNVSRPYTIKASYISTYTYKWSNYDDTKVLSYISDLQNEVNDIETNYASKEWVEDKGYLTEHQSLDDYATINYVDATVDEIPLTEEQMNELFPLEINQ